MAAHTLDLLPSCESLKVGMVNIQKDNNTIKYYNYVELYNAGYTLSPTWHGGYSNHEDTNDKMIKNIFSQ